MLIQLISNAITVSKQGNYIRLEVTSSMQDEDSEKISFVV